MKATEDKLDDPIPHHLSAEQHQLNATEDQLLKDGRMWLRRAADLYTRTPKIKIWLPVACSMLITTYTLYSMHARAASVPEPPQLSGQPAPVAVAVTDDTPSGKAGQTVAVVAGAGQPGSISEGNAPDSDRELIKLAQQARAGQQFGDEANLLQKVFDHSQAPQQVCPAIGKAYERAGEIGKAIQAFEQCESLAPANLDTLVAFAHVLQAKPDFPRATALLKECLTKDPRNLDAQTGLALIELKQNHLGPASEAATAILRDWPDNTDALLISGVVAWRESRLAEA